MKIIIFLSLVIFLSKALNAEDLNGINLNCSTYDYPNLELKTENKDNDVIFPKSLTGPRPIYFTINFDQKYAYINILNMNNELGVKEFWGSYDAKLSTVIIYGGKTDTTIMKINRQTLNIDNTDDGITLFGLYFDENDLIEKKTCSIERNKKNSQNLKLFKRIWEYEKKKVKAKNKF